MMSIRRIVVVLGTVVGLLWAGAQAEAALAVTSVVNKSVYTFDSSGNGTFRGNGVAFASGVTWLGNDIVFSDTFAGPGNMKRIDPSNNVTFVSSYPGVVTPVGLASDAAGNLYSTDYLTGRVVVTDPFGASTVFANLADGLRRPTGIDLDDQGNVYVADPRAKQIIKFTPAGVPSVFATAADGLVTPLDVAVDAFGNVYVADFSIVGGTVWKFGPSGGTPAVFANAADGISGPTGLAVDPSNNDVYVANYLVDTIVKLDPLGNASLFADGSDGLDGPLQLEFNNSVVPEPSSLAIWSVVGLLGLVWRRRACSRVG